MFSCCGKFFLSPQLRFFLIHKLVFFVYFCLLSLYYQSLFRCQRVRCKKRLSSLNLARIKSFIIIILLDLSYSFNVAKETKPVSDKSRFTSILNGTESGVRFTRRMKIVFLRILRSPALRIPRSEMEWGQRDASLFTHRDRCWQK